MYCSKPHLTLERHKDYSMHQKRIDRILKEHRMKECHWDHVVIYPKSNKERSNRFIQQSIS